MTAVVVHRQLHHVFVALVRILQVSAMLFVLVFFVSSTRFYMTPVMMAITRNTRSGWFESMRLRTRHGCHTAWALRRW